MEVNLFGVIIGAQRAARHMKDHGGGSIINNASIAAINAGPGMISYRSVEGGDRPRHQVHGHRPRPVRHPGQLPDARRTSAPGITNYEMGPVLQYMQPLEREAQPEDVANAVVFLASDRAAQITGIVLPIDGGTTAGPPLAQTKLIMSTAAEAAGRRAVEVSRAEPLEAAEEERRQVLVAAVAGRAVVRLGDGDVGGAVEEAG